MPFTLKLLLPHKSIKICCNYILGALLFGWLAFSIVQQVANQRQLDAAWLQVQQAFFTRHIILLVAAVVLVGVNWGLEARKWQISFRPILPVSFFHALRSVLSGVAFAVGTPNRSGEFLGRMLLLRQGVRLQSLAFTAVGGLAQLWVTVGAGLAGIWVMRPYLKHLLPAQTNYHVVVWMVGVAWVLLGICYFRCTTLVPLLKRLGLHRHTSSLVAGLVQCDKRLLCRLLWLSVLRYVVFLMQYLLVFRFFGVEVPADVLAPLMGVWFLVMTIVPSVALAEVGLRGKLSLLLVGAFSDHTLGIALTSLTLWLLNLVLPAIVGSIIVLHHRFFAQIHKPDECSDTYPVNAAPVVDAGCA